MKINKNLSIFTTPQTADDDLKKKETPKKHKKAEADRKPKSFLEKLLGE